MARKRAGKRANGEGGLYQRGDGMWAATLDLKDGSRAKRFYAATQGAAIDKREAARAEIARTGVLAHGHDTVGTYLVDWLAASKSQWRANTYAGHERMLRLHIIPRIGKILLARLRPQDLEKCYEQLLDGGLSARTVQLAHVIIHRALGKAERQGTVARNVARLVDAPRPSRHEIQPLSPDEIQQLLATAKDDPLQALYVLAVTTGLRSGELLGLRWADIDLGRGSLHVRQQAQRTSEGWTFPAPKTDAGRRSVTLPTIAVDSLRAHRIQQNTERLARASAWEDLDLVFANELGRPMERQNLQRRSFGPLLARAGLRHIRFHDLRHSAATLLLSEGVHPKVVQERLGHASIAVTMDVYSHILPTLQAEAAAKLDRFFAQG